MIASKGTLKVTPTLYLLQEDPETGTGRTNTSPLAAATTGGRSTAGISTGRCTELEHQDSFCLTRSVGKKGKHSVTVN